MAVPFTRMIVPTVTPAISRRPWNTTDSEPVPSVSTHSRLGTSASGRTRIDRTRPSTVTRSRQRTLAMAVGPSPAAIDPFGGGAAGAATAVARAGAATTVLA